MTDAEMVEGLIECLALAEIGAASAEDLARIGAPTYTTLAETLRWWRRHRRMTQGLLAERAGVTQTYISLLERGGRDGIGLDIAVRLARALGIPLAILARPFEREIDRRGGRASGLED